MKSKQTTITPAIAKEYLRHNTKNRNIRQAHVDFLAGEMESGRFLLTHQGIAFDTKGNLIDGQHRLLAIIQCGKTIEMMVTRDSNEDNFDVVDLGGVTRSVADILHLSDGLMEANLVTAACRSIISTCSYFQSVKMQVGLARIVLDEYGEQLSYVSNIVVGFKPARKSWVVGTLALCLRVDKKVEDFIIKFATGENIKNGDPAKTARDWLVNGSSSFLKGCGKYKRGAIEVLTNSIYNSSSGNEIKTAKAGARGLEFYLNKNKSFVERIRAQLKQQLLDEPVKK